MARSLRAWPMARAARREQLLAVARDIIAEDGLRTLTMASLAKRAGIAKPVVYIHFADREAVAVALIEEHFKAVMDVFSARTAPMDTLPEYIASVVEAAFAFETVSDIPIRKITNGFSAGDAVNQAFLRYEVGFEDHWRTLMARLGVPVDTANVIAPMLSSMVSHAVYTFSDTDRRGLAKAALKTLLTNSLQLYALEPSSRSACAV